MDDRKPRHARVGPLALLLVLLTTPAPRAWQRVWPHEVEDPGALTLEDARRTGRHAIVGRVVDQDLRPVVGAFVEARRVDVADGAAAEATVVETTTLVNGRYDLVGLDAGNWLVTVVGSQGAHSQAELREIARRDELGGLPPGVAVGHDLVAAPASSARSWTYNASTIGLPFSEGELPSVRGRITGWSSPDGYLLLVHWGPSSCHGCKPENFTLLPEGTRLNSVHFTSRVDGEGRFDLGPIRPKPYDSFRVRAIPTGDGAARNVSYPGHAQPLIPRKAQDPGALAIEVEPHAPVRVVCPGMRGDDAANPYRRFGRAAGKIRVQPLPASSRQSGVERAPAAGSEFVDFLLPHGRYQASAAYPGGVGHPTTFVVDGAGDRLEVVLRTTDRPAIEFDVIDPEGAAIEGLHLFLVRADELPAHDIQVEGGHVRILGLPPGSYWFEAADLPDGFVGEFTPRAVRLDLGPDMEPVVLSL